MLLSFGVSGTLPPLPARRRRYENLADYKEHAGQRFCCDGVSDGANLLQS
jgi:hypothetical protein